MPINADDNKYYDFERLFFEKKRDVDDVITSFFTKYKDDIKGDTEYITYKIKKLIEEDRNFIIRINGNGQESLYSVQTYFVPIYWYKMWFESEQVLVFNIQRCKK